jgi:threonine aldolase
MTLPLPPLIDLRSDTITRPTPGMRQAMAEALVGDDVFGEDPTVRALEEEVATLTGKEAALFVPSGTMGNQLAIACHTRPGDEVIIGEGAHVAFYEVGAGAALSGVQFVVAGRGGLFSVAELLERIKPDAYFYPRTSLVALENTHNRAGGMVFPQAEVRAIADAARARGLALHLDGARIWNASVATGLAVETLAAPFDTVSVCFSKGLGAPVGSALAGQRSLVERARRFRKMWGGGMRQAGILAAGARYALAHHRARLADDHANARAFAEILAEVDGAEVRLDDVVTNIVNVGLDAPIEADEVARVARRIGVALNSTGPRRLRVVTHLDVSRDDVLEGAARLAQAVREVKRATVSR